MPRSARRPTAHLLIAMAVTALAIAPAAGAQTASPFNPLPQAPAQTAQTTVPTTSSQSNQISDGLQTWQAILIVLGGVILIFGIAMAILRDARGRAPVAQDDDRTPQRSRDAHITAQNAKRRQRAKAKAIRAQRRRNR